VKLANGFYENTQQRFTVTLVNRQGWIDFGDVNGDRVEDAAILLSVNSGGSGQFAYLVTVLSVGDQMQPSTPALLGDRVQIKSIDINNGQITVNMVTQGPKDPFCCPTQKVTWVYKTQPALVQVSSDPAESMNLPGSLPQNNTSDAKDTIMAFQTQNHAVRVFRQNGQFWVNLYNKRTQVTELNSAPVTVESASGGTAYLYKGEMAVRVFAANDGAQLLEINGKLQ
jgi:hypothetical protein